MTVWNMLTIIVIMQCSEAVPKSHTPQSAGSLTAASKATTLPSAPTSQGAASTGTDKTVASPGYMDAVTKDWYALSILLYIFGQR